MKMTKAKSNWLTGDRARRQQRFMKQRRPRSRSRTPDADGTLLVVSGHALDDKRPAGRTDSFWEGLYRRTMVLQNHGSRSILRQSRAMAMIT